MKRGIPLAAMEKILRKAGISRANEDAKEALRTYCEEIIAAYTLRAKKLAAHAGRKTIRREDITLVHRE